MGSADITRWPLYQVTVNVADHLSGVGDVAAGELRLCLAQQRNDLHARAVAHRFATLAGFETHGLGLVGLQPIRKDVRGHVHNLFEVCKSVVRSLRGHLDAAVLICFNAAGLCAASLPVRALCTNN